MAPTTRLSLHPERRRDLNEVIMRSRDRHGQIVDDPPRAADPGSMSAGEKAIHHISEFVQEHVTLLSEAKKMQEHNSKLQEDLAESRRENKGLIAELRRISEEQELEQLQGIKNRYLHLEEDVSQMQKDLDRVREELRSVKSELAEKTERLSQLRTALAPLIA